MRIGQALPGEPAAWRYGDELRRRRWKALLGFGSAIAAGIGVVTAGRWRWPPWASSLLPARQRGKLEMSVIMLMVLVPMSSLRWARDAFMENVPRSRPTPPAS